MRIQPSYNQLFTDPYSFQAQEHDDEVKGDGNSHDFGARMFDSRLGRFLSRDSYESKFAYQSPYIFGGNNPITCVDINGDSVLFYSESGKFLGYSNDNQRYKGHNFACVISEKDVKNFKKCYDQKRLITNIPKGNKKDVYIEACVAGLASMSKEVYDVTAFVSFFDKTYGKTLKGGKLVPISEDKKKNEQYSEFTAPMIYKNLNFKVGSQQVDIKVIVPDESKMEDGGSDDVFSIVSPDGLGKFHTHAGGFLNQTPTYTQDYVNGSKTSMNVVVSGTRFNLFKCSGTTEYGVTNSVNIPIERKNSTNGKSKGFTDKANKQNGTTIK